LTRPRTGEYGDIRALMRWFDAVFGGPPADVLAAEVVDTPDVRNASDHLPVLAELGQPDGPGSAG
jgi:endonuclease/exonuclease/phosphatase family metal-dependent hydrolase